MRYGLRCVECMISRQVELAKANGDEEKGVKYLKEVMKIIANAPEEAASPYISSRCNRVFAEMYYPGDRFKEIKKRSNEFVMSQADYVREKIAASGDPLKTAIKFARVGNYIDFGALRNDVNDETFLELMEKAEGEYVDEAEYNNFTKELSQGENVVYLTDNAGEIVLDVFLIEQIKKRYPHINVNVIVRGGPIHNDATIEDAKAVGLTEMVDVTDNGTDIAGTDLEEISGDAMEIIKSADVIISKGQGNFETLHGCGLNIYYIFLCKCDWFVDIFGLPKFSGMFLNEKRMKKIRQDH